MQETIFALSSGALPSGVAVVRVSGPEVPEILAAMIQEDVKPRQASLQPIRSRNGDAIDTGLVLSFPAPRSFTGEDCLELHLHGGRAVVQRLLDELLSFPGTRPAEAGEFTRRAFENGKIDLLEAEGLADLVSAETEMQRRLAVEHVAGGLSAVYHRWADRLTYGRAMIEAELDFADEEDVPGSVATTIWQDMHDLALEIEAHLAHAKTGEIIRDGFKIAILGKPNAGKSSLLNALARRDIAIVTDIAGTTRDVIAVDLNIAGYAVRVSDTAGIRATDDPVEQEGVRRAYAAAEDADLVLLLEDYGDRLEDELRLPEGKPVLSVVTKIDLISDRLKDPRLGISTVTTQGLDELIVRIQDEIEKHVNVNSLAIPSRIRHVSYLKETLACLRSALDSKDSDLDIRSEFLRRASHALGKITGTVDVEALLGIIFSEFCIGK